MSYKGLLLMNEANNAINKLFDFFETNSTSELADKIKVSQPTISKWKNRNSINAIKKKCRELGIYDEIFDNSNQQIVHNNFGQNAQNVDGDQNFNSDSTKKNYDIKFNDSIQKRLLTISTLLDDDNMDSFDKCLKEWIVNNL